MATLFAEWLARRVVRSCTTCVNDRCVHKLLDSEFREVYPEFDAVRWAARCTLWAVTKPEDEAE